MTPDPEFENAIERLLDALADPLAPTSIHDRAKARRIHIADSLVALQLEPLARARTIADIGAGAGLPGLVIAAALPNAQVVLVEATKRKCEFIRTAANAAGIENCRVVNERIETWAAGGGREAYQVVTARALAPLAALLEFASPLLVDQGHLVAWKGAPDPAELVAAGRTERLTAMVHQATVEVAPYPESRDRSLYLYRKLGPTPQGLPRRVGMVRKRPLGQARFGNDP